MITLCIFKIRVIITVVQHYVFVKIKKSSVAFAQKKRLLRSCIIKDYDLRISDRSIGKISLRLCA